MFYNKYILIFVITMRDKQAHYLKLEIMKTLTNYSELVELVSKGESISNSSLDLEFDLFQYAECEREVNGYTVKDFENGISLIDAGDAWFVLTDMVVETIKNIDDFYNNN